MTNLEGVEEVERAGEWMGCMERQEAYKRSKKQVCEWQRVA